MVYTSSNTKYVPSYAEGLRVFMDNSNLYISAKRMVAAKLGLQEPWTKVGDPRFRIDYSKLRALVEANTWEIETASEDVCLRSSVVSVDLGIYGSDMAKLEGILKEKGARFVNIPFRGTQEKQVDASIIVDIGRLLRLLPKDRELVREEDVIVLIAGDGDFIPVVEDAISEGWRIEVWSFSQVTARHFARLSHTRDDHGYPILRTVNLDDYLFSGRMGYIEYEAKEYSNEATCIVHLNSMLSEDEAGTPAQERYTAAALNKWAKMQVCVTSKALRVAVVCKCFKFLPVYALPSLCFAHNTACTLILTHKHAHSGKEMGRGAHKPLRVADNVCLAKQKEVVDARVLQPRTRARLGHLQQRI
jgi:uncharacterized LabA/DUF88 family protein